MAGWLVKGVLQLGVANTYSPKAFSPITHTSLALMFIQCRYKSSAAKLTNSHTLHCI